MNQSSDPQSVLAHRSRVRDRWNARAGWWDEMSEENRQAPDRTADLAWTIRALQLTAGTRVLDAGCGTGQFALAFADHGCQVTAIDLSPEMVARARQHALEANLDAIDWRVGDFSRLADPDASFDAIHARNTIHLLTDPHQALIEFRRLLRPGGVLYLAIPGAASPIYSGAWQRFLPGDQWDMSYITPWDLEQLLAALDWTIVDQWSNISLKAAVDPDDQASAAFLRLPRHLQQTAAFNWTIIAR